MNTNSEEANLGAKVDVPQSTSPTRRNFLGAVGIVTVGATLGARSARGVGSTSSSSGRLLSMPVEALSGPAATTMQVQAAQALGEFSKNGLKPTIELSTNDTVPLLLGGHVAVVLQAVNTVLSAVAQGADLVIIGGAGTFQPYYLVTKKSITSVKDLKGALLATSDTSTSTTYLIYLQLLGQVGLSASDVQFRVFPVGTQRTQALITGQVDGSLVSLDQVPIILSSSGGSNLHVLDKNPAGTNFPLRPYLGITTTQTYIDTHSEDLTRFMLTMISTNRALADSRSDFVKTTTQVVEGATQKDAAAVYEPLRDYWGANGGLEPQWIAPAAAYTKQKDKLGHLPPTNSLYNTKFMKAALDKLGVVKSAHNPATWYKK
jgi:ABC-type nitrate/sulfonate/bicarbonate transport system substrate-binding protein